MRGLDAAISTTPALHLTAPASTPATSMAGGVAVRANGPVSEASEAAIPIELVMPTPEEQGAVMSLASRSGLDVRTRTVAPSVRHELETLNDPVVDRSTRLVEHRDQLLNDLRAGKGDPAKLIKQLDGLSVLIDVVRRQEEKRALMKKLLKQLLMGALTPETIRLAKQLGLVEFLKEAIKEMVKRGFMSPEAVKAIAGMLQDAGIAMPILDDILIRHQRSVDGRVNAARDARGLDPVTNAAGPSGAIVGAQTLVGDTTGLS